MSDSDSPASQSSIDLLRLLAAGDEGAAATVFERYAERLTRLARSRLAARLAQRIDSEDVVMSAYRSFFVAARQGRFELDHGGDLWRLLVELTLHKLYRSVQHHQAQRRSMQREVPLPCAHSANISLAAPEPTPDEVAVAAEELAAVLERLPARSRQALELRLQGFEHEEIAERLSCNERTVRRWLNEARRVIVARGGQDFIPSAARRGKQGQKPPRPPPITLEAANAQSPLRWSDYILRQQIGAGATGKVYRALQKNDNREVAIKFLKKSLTTSSAMIERFVREAQVVAELDHPGIVAVHGIGQTPGGGLFLVMDLVRGRDLDLVRRAGPVDPLQAAAWVAEAARIVHAAHERGIIHCDLKPSNLLLDETGRILVTDFGLAIRSADAAAGILAGTPAFMAPEQVDPVWGAISPRTDVWGLGGVLYFLIAGYALHTDPDLASVLARTVSAAPVTFPAPEFDAVSQEVLAALRQCLAKRPDDRLSSAIQLADRLQSPSTLS